MHSRWIVGPGHQLDRVSGWKTKAIGLLSRDACQNKKDLGEDVGIRSLDRGVIRFCGDRYSVVDGDALDMRPDENGRDCSTGRPARTTPVFAHASPRSSSSPASAKSESTSKATGWADHGSSFGRILLTTRRKMTPTGPIW